VSEFWLCVCEFESFVSLIAVCAVLGVICGRGDVQLSFVSGVL
jgi:hypothetical protein